MKYFSPWIITWIMGIVLYVLLLFGIIKTVLYIDDNAEITSLEYTTMQQATVAHPPLFELFAELFYDNKITRAEKKRFDAARIKQ